MKARIVGFFAAIGICSLSGAFLLIAVSNSQIMPNQPLLASDGLQMSISISGSEKVDSPTLQVALQNVGDKDVKLNLGMMLANGKVQLPNNIRLHLKDAAGQTRELHFADKRCGAIVGRMDDYVVPLRVGSTYTLLLKLEQFWSSEANEFAEHLRPGKYQVSAQIEGKGAKADNSDSEEVASLNLWRGKLQSNVLSFER